MTLTAPPGNDATSQLWSTMPGWGITANLLPPEVVAARRLKAIRKIIVAGLIAVVVLAGAGYAYAFFQDRSAHDGLLAEQQRTAALLAQKQHFSEVVTLTGSISQIKGQLGTLMAGDVDATKLVDALLAPLPHGGAITQLQVNFDAGQAQVSTAAQSNSGLPTGAAALDTSGQTHIGSVTITGTAKTLPQVASYVTSLSMLPGVVSVYPTSLGTGTSGSTPQFTLQLTLTDTLLTHRFDVAPTGGTPATAPTGGK